MNGFRNNWSRRTNLFWFWLATVLAVGTLVDIAHVYFFNNDGTEFWLAWAFWDRIIKIVMLSLIAWMYHGAARHAKERDSALGKI